MNEVNNKFDNNDTNLGDVKNNHMNRVGEAYRRLGYNYIYPYFDGTNLVNSLFSCIVVPLEYLKGRYKKDYNRIDELFKEKNIYAYKECLAILESLNNNGNIVDTYHTYHHYTHNVYGFFEHLRNALSHSGNGQIHFFPINNGGRDITHLYFYDEKNNTSKYGNEFKKCFLAKIDILNELVPLVDAFDEIIISIVDNNTPYNLEYIKEQVRRLAKRDIP